MTPPTPPQPAEVLAEALAVAGTTTAFGLPGGGPNLDVVGALAKRDIDFVLAHTETAACIMASTWGWLKGRPSAAIVTRGPGAASAVNGAAQATLDRAPLLLVTDTVAEASRARIVHQRIDQVQMLAPACKGTVVLGRDSCIADVAAAIELTNAWPKGAVHIEYDESAPGSRVTTQHQPPVPGSPANAGLRDAHELLASASHPVLIVGVAAVDDAAGLRAAIELFGAPTLTTYQAIGVIPTEHDLCAGLFTNGAAERGLLDQADLIVTIGLDMVEPIPASWTYTTPVVSIAPIATSDPYLPHVMELVGVQSRIAAELLVTSHAWSPTAGREHRVDVRKTLAAPAMGFSPVGLVTTLIEHVPAAATVTVDAGAHFLAIMPLWPVAEAKQLLISNGLATMGYALPAAIGAALARPEQPVLALVGDGGLGMTLAELETIARLDLPITVVVFNDSALSLIEIKQQPQHGGDGAVRYAPTDFAAIAEAMGVPGVIATTRDGVAEALAGHETHTPLLIDARIDPASYPHLIEVTRG